MAEVVLYNTAWEPGFWSTQRGAYHADRECACHSALEVFKDSIPLYYAMFVSGEIVQPVPNDAQAFGTAFHTLILEPGEFDSQFIVQSDKIDRRTNAGKEAFAVFQEKAGTRLILSQDQRNSLLKMEESIYANPSARRLLEAKGLVEKAIRWKDPETGMPMRALLDITTEEFIVDLKTTNDPTPTGFAKDCANFGYHRQASLYREGFFHAFRGPLPKFYFIAVGKDFPHETFVYQLAQDSMLLGSRQNARLIGELHVCKTFDQWHSRNRDEIVTLDLPKWAFYQE